MWSQHQNLKHPLPYREPSTISWRTCSTLNLEAVSKVGLRVKLSNFKSVHVPKAVGGWRLEDALEEAWKAFQNAREELERYRIEGDQMILRNAAEKGWLAVNKAIEALLKAHGVEARTYREKRDQLVKIGFETLRDRFAAREKLLHIDCFYDGMCDEEFVSRELAKVEEMLREIESLIEGLARR
jgi:hypothetical protein